MNDVSLSYSDSADNDKFSNLVGSLSATELTNGKISYGIVGVTSLASSGYFEKKGVYGTLKVYKYTGTYVFIPNDAAIESLKSNETETFSVTAQDSAADAQADVIIDITGVDDSISVSSNTATLLESATAKKTGKLILSDRDDVLGSAPVVAQSDVATTYGFFSIQANGQWTYQLDNTNATAMTMNRGDTLTEDIDVITSLSGETVKLTITIIGQGGFGTTGKDRLIGNQFDEVLTGYAGNDFLDGGEGDDTMIGGVGNDTYVVDSESDVITELANEGIDNIQLTIASPSATFEMTTKAEAVENLKITSHVDQNVDGNALDNNITGNEKNNQIQGLDGNDTLTGGAGNDSLIGGDGNDVLRGDSGIDELTGGLGDDSYFSFLNRDASSGIVSIEDTIVEGVDEGYDVLTLSYVNQLGQHYDNQIVNIPDNIEVLKLLVSGYTKTTNYIIFKGNDLDNKMIGDGSANSLSGEDGNDFLYGGAGQDSLTGGAGDDYVSGQQGIDTIYGGLGNDSLYGGSDNDQLYGEDDDDLLSGDVGNDDLDTGTGDNTASGGNGNDIIYANDGNDLLTGDNGNDLIFAGSGDDTIDGGNGSDIIQAGDGNDTIYIGNGRELVVGGDGNDMFSFNQKSIVSSVAFKSNVASFAIDFTTKSLYEYSVLSKLDYKYYDIGVLILFGTNYDLFYSQVSGGLAYEYSKIKPFKSFFNYSIITDFVAGEDALSFDSSVFTALTDIDTQFHSGTSNDASSGDDRLIYNQSTGDLFYDADGTGSALAYHLVTLQGQPTITTSDLSLI